MSPHFPAVGSGEKSLSEIFLLYHTINLYKEAREGSSKMEEAQSRVLNISANCQLQCMEAVSVFEIRVLWGFQPAGCLVTLVQLGGLAT